MRALVEGPEKGRRRDCLNNARVRLLLQERKAVVVRIVHGLDNFGFALRGFCRERRRRSLSAYEFEQLDVDQRDMQDLLAVIALRRAVVLKPNLSSGMASAISAIVFSWRCGL